jgi:hypothetical protein
MKQSGVIARLAIAGATLLAVHSASAQGLYRCGAEGRTFSQVPCDGGHAVDAAREPTAAQRAEATEVARRESELARQLTEERIARETSVRAPEAVGIRGTMMRKQGVQSRLGPKKKEARHKGGREGRSNGSFGSVD